MYVWPQIVKQSLVKQLHDYFIVDSNILSFPFQHPGSVITTDVDEPPTGPQGLDPGLQVWSSLFCQSLHHTQSNFTQVVSKCLVQNNPKL